ncbi:ricin-type beta-trefoil lectin domain protein [Amycolatopsis sp. NPDC051071]|uniref:RICIN domain-containing protein n=1 Tax=Amycolatopsis sp. NPDC051071 TaxID=3154637 RepID=UPI00342EACA6
MIKRGGRPARIRAVALVVLSLLFGLSGIGTAAAAPKAAMAAAGFTLKSRLNDKCLDIKDINPNAGAQVIVWDCWDNPGQRWHWVGASLHSDLNHKCLDIKDINPNHGALVQMWNCWDTPGQHWYWWGQSLRSSLNDLCLDIKDVNPASGALVQMWDCWAIAGQHWY